MVRIRSALEARTDEKAFFDALAEAVLARHVLSLGFDVETEVPTVGNMTADLRVSKGGREVFLHVKRVATDIDNRASRQIVISPRLRALEMVPRPWLIRVRWSSVANDRQMQRLVEEGMDFLRHASVGDELKVTDHDGSDLGGIRVLARWTAGGAAHWDARWFHRSHAANAQTFGSGFRPIQARSRKCHRRGQQ